jgi:hypothetical protein
MKEKESAVARENSEGAPLRIIQDENGRYRIAVTAPWPGPEEPPSMAMLEPIGEWASLDRLVRHIQEHYGEVSTIWLTLHSRETLKCDGSEASVEKT